MFNRIQQKIIENGVKNLHEFGYTAVNQDNIFTDWIYAQMFERMIEENLGQGLDDELKPLLQVIKERKETP